MPSVSFSIPKYRQHKGSGQAFVQVNRKRHYLGKFGTPESKQRYSRFVAELAVRPAAASPVTPADKPVLTVVELLRRLPRLRGGVLRQGWSDHLAYWNGQARHRYGQQAIRRHYRRRLWPIGAPRSPAEVRRKRPFPQHNQLDVRSDQANVQVGRIPRNDPSWHVPSPCHCARATYRPHRRPRAGPDPAR